MPITTESELNIHNLINRAVSKKPINLSASRINKTETSLSQEV